MKKYQHIDLNYLNDLALGSKEFMQEILNTFLKTTPDSIEKMRNSVETKDWKMIGGIAHKLKTSFSFVGMNDMVELSKVLQDYGLNAKEVDKIPELINQMQLAYLKAEQELKQELVKL